MQTLDRVLELVFPELYVFETPASTLENGLLPNEAAVAGASAASLASASFPLREALFDMKLPLSHVSTSGAPSEAAMSTASLLKQQQLADVDSFAGLMESQPPESKRMRLDTAEATAAAAASEAAVLAMAQAVGLVVTPEEQPHEAAAATEAVELSGLQSATYATATGASTAPGAAASDMPQQSEMNLSAVKLEMSPIESSNLSANAAQANFMRGMIDLGGSQLQEDSSLEQFAIAGLLPPSVSAASVATPGPPPEDAAMGLNAIAPSPAAAQQSAQEASASATSSGTAFTSNPLKALSQLLYSLHVPRSCAARQRTLPATDTGLELHDVFALSPLFLWHLLRKRLNEQPGILEASSAGGGAPFSPRPASPCASLFDRIASNCDFNQQPVALLVMMNVRQQVQVYLLQLMEALQPLCPEMSNAGASSSAPAPRVITDRLPHAIPTFATGMLRIGSSSPPATTSGSATGGSGIGALSLEFLEQLPLQTRVLFLNVCFSRTMTLITKMPAVNHSHQLPIALTPDFVETLSNLTFSSDLNLCMQTIKMFLRCTSTTADLWLSYENQFQPLNRQSIRHLILILAQHLLAALKLAFVCISPSQQQQQPGRPMWQRLQCVWVLSALLEFIAHRMLCTWNGGPAHRGDGEREALRAAGEVGGAGAGALMQQQPSPPPPMPARADGSLVLSSYHALQTRLTLHALLAAAQRQEQLPRQPATTASYALYFAYEIFQSLCTSNFRYTLEIINSSTCKYCSFVLFV